MNVPSVLLPRSEWEHQETIPTKIIYLPDEDRFLVIQGDDLVNEDGDAETSLDLTLIQILQLADVVQHPSFMDAMAFCRASLNGKHIN